MNSQNLPVAVIGAGPVGLAAAAHLLENDETPIVFEAGSEIGANVRHWGHVRMFSPWEYVVDKAVVRMLSATDWEMPPANDLPTGNELVDKYMLPFSNLPEVIQHIHLNTKVTAISRRAIDKMKDAGRDSAPFVIRLQCEDGSEDIIEARAVIDASGTWHNPNPLGADGLPAIGESQYRDRIFYGIPDIRNGHKARYANKKVAVVGSGHSAINALLELADIKKDYPDTGAIWVLRNRNLERIYGGLDDDELEARGALGQYIKNLVDAGIVTIEAPFRIRKIQSNEQALVVTGETPAGFKSIHVDEIISTTGVRPDLDLVRELRVSVDSSLESTITLAPLIDPNIHSCGSVPPHGEAELRHAEKNFYIVGMKSYGRAPTFLLATGYEQVRSVVAALVGDWEAARDVQLNLPETGICNTNFSEDDASCGGSTPVAVGAVIPVENLVTVSVQSDNKKPKSACCG